MGTGRNNSKATVTALNQQLETALAKYFGEKSIVIDGQTWTSSDLIAGFKKEDGLIAAADRAHAAWLQAASAAREQTAVNAPLRVGVRAAVKLQLGMKSSALPEFGIPIRQPKSRTGQTNVTAAQKAAATRKARGTLGRKQRLAITSASVTPTAASSAAPAATAVNGAASPGASGPTVK